MGGSSAVAIFKWYKILIIFKMFLIFWLSEEKQKKVLRLGIFVVFVTLVFVGWGPSVMVPTGAPAQPR